MVDIVGICSCCWLLVVGRGGDELGDLGKMNGDDDGWVRWNEKDRKVMSIAMESWRTRQRG